MRTALLAGACTLSLGLCPSALAQSPAKSRPAAQAKAPAYSYAQSEAAMAFATDLAERRNLDPAWVRQQIGSALRIPTVIRLMQPAPSGSPKNWAAYRARFIEPVRLRAGQRFWEANRDTLARAEAEFGVPASLIVGVIGVETLYGQHTGNFRVIDALDIVAEETGKSIPQIAINWLLQRPTVSTVLIGARNEEQLRQNLGAIGWQLSADQIASAGKFAAAADYRGFEFCGACFSPDGTTLFVNIQRPGLTLAITGPWGNLRSHAKGMDKLG